MKHWFILLAVLSLLAVRLASPGHDNPPESAPIVAPADVASVFERSCYDCHSHRTEWPWYSHVPLVSWFVGNHVKEGREHLNFSTWGEMSEGNRLHAVMEIVEEVEKGEMPLSGYVKLHTDAALSEPDIALIRGWAGAEGVAPGVETEDHAH